MAEYATILVDDTGPVARVTLNLPDKRNPISPLMCGELVHALRTVEARVVVLTGAGAVFSAGGDLAGMTAAGDGGAPPATLVELFTAMHELGKPIIAMVNGHALAGGLGLMVACDLVVAADTATFGTTEIAVGLWPMMITAELTRSVGRKQILEMMLTGRKMPAREAAECGLVNRVVSRRRSSRPRRCGSRTRSPIAVPPRSGSVCWRSIDHRTWSSSRSSGIWSASSDACWRSKTPPKASRRSSASASRCGKADEGRRHRSRAARDPARR